MIRLRPYSYIFPKKLFLTQKITKNFPKLKRRSYFQHSLPKMRPLAAIIHVRSMHLPGRRYGHVVT